MDRYEIRKRLYEDFGEDWVNCIIGTITRGELAGDLGWSYKKTAIHCSGLSLMLGVWGERHGLSADEIDEALFGDKE